MIDDAGPAAHQGAGRPPTYTSWLRERSDAELDALLAARPDLLTPVPADIAALAARAASRPSVVRVLDQLHLFELQVLEGVVALGDERSGRSPHGVAPSALATAMAAPTDRFAAALERLRATALVWEEEGRLRPVTALRDILPRPAGLGPPLRVLLSGRPLSQLDRLAADLGLPTGYGEGDPADRLSAALCSPDRVDALLDDAGPDARSVLDRLVWGPPDGTVSQARPDADIASAASPVERLLARGLLYVTGEHTVTLPREIALRLRGGRLFREAAPHPPELDGPQRSPLTVTRAAAGQAFTVIRYVEELVEHWAEDPPSVLRSGGLGVRDLRRSARLLDTDDTTAAVVIEAAHTAGLIAATSEVDGEWLPTGHYDVWRVTEPARRWALLASAWLGSTRVASLAGSTDARGRSRNVLGEGLDRRPAPEVRRDVLGVLAEAPEGTAPTRDSIAARLAWRRPRRQGRGFDELLDSTLAEAALLGLTGRDALAPHTRALLDETTDGQTVAEAADSATVRALAAELPEPVDHILIQGDLTAIAPGPLVPSLARELALAADVESTGGATVYRFGESSIRRALDAGHGAADLIGLLERHSKTPLPQALRYLIADVARRHGRLRVGTASSYLRCDEPALLDELLGDRRADDLVLVRLAPTVVASRTTRPVLLDRLTELGYHPVPEAADGTMQLSRPDARRAEEHAPDGGLDSPPVPGPRLRAAAVRALRAGDEAATAARTPVAAPPNGPSRPSTAATLTALNRAAAQGQRVWIGYLDPEGRASSHIVEPQRVDGGFLTAYDATRDAVRRFTVHRITGVASLERDGA
ncbi:helicase-associated domain-containing protein [Marinactinospora endophytica]